MSSTFDRLVKDLIGAMKVASSPKTSPLDTTAEVVRVEDGIAWVHLPGGVDETPVSLTVAVSPGDTVQVRINSGKAWITGNATAPPTDDKKAIEAGKVAQAAQEKVNVVGEVAEGADSKAKDALKLAEGTNEHFWHNETGAHITQVTQEEYEDDPANAGGNTLITSNGFAVRDGTTGLASFTGSGTQVGQDDRCVQITPGSIKMKLIDWYGNVREFLKFTESSGGLLRLRAPYVVGEVLQYFDTTRITEKGLKIFRGKQTTEDDETCYVDLDKDGLRQMVGSGTSVDPEIKSNLSAGSLLGQARYGGVTVDTVDLDFEKGTLDLTGVTSGLSVDNGITAGGHPSGLLAEDIVIGDGLIIAAGQYGTGNLSITKSGYTPLGIVGVHLENATSGGIYNTYVFTHSWYINNGKAYFIFRNTHSADAKIKVTVTVLYAKT